MPYLSVRLAASQSVTDDGAPSPTTQHDDTQCQEGDAAADPADPADPADAAVLRHENNLACLATVGDAQQQCDAARALLADANERIVCSQHALAADSDGQPRPAWPAR